MWHPKVSVRLVTALMAVAMAATACGDGGDSGKTTVRFANWAAAETATQGGIEALIEEFEADNPDIEVVSEPISFSDIAHQVLREAQAQEAPDVVQIAGNDMLSLAEAGILQPLDSYSESYQDQIIPEVLELGVVSDELVAVPWAVTPFGFWYNKKVMADAGLDPDSPPTTMSELVSAMATVSEQTPGVIPIGLDTTNRSFGLDVNWSFMQSFGATPFEGETVSADSAQMREYLEFVRMLGTEKYTEINKKVGDFRPIAADDKVAFMWDGPYLKNTMQATNDMPDKEFYDTWGVTTLPSGESGTPVSVPTDHQLAMTTQSENSDAAWKFIEFLSTSESGLDYTVNTTGGLTPLTDPPSAVAEQLDNPISTAFTEDVIPTVTRPPWGERYGKAYSPVMAGVQSAMTSDTAIDEIAAQMQEQLQTAVR